MMKSYLPLEVELDSPVPGVAADSAGDKVVNATINAPTATCSRPYALSRTGRPSRYAPLKHISDECLRRARTEQAERAQQRKCLLRSDA